MRKVYHQLLRNPKNRGKASDVVIPLLKFSGLEIKVWLDAMKTVPLSVTSIYNKNVILIHQNPNKNVMGGDLWNERY